MHKKIKIALLLIFLFFFVVTPNIVLSKSSPDWLDVAKAKIAAHKIDNDNDFYYEIYNTKSLSNWAVISVYRVSKSTNNSIPSSGTVIIVNKDNLDNWVAILPDEMELFNEAVIEVPLGLLDKFSKEILLIPTKEKSFSPENKTGYRLPWPAQLQAYVNTNYNNHGLGQIDFGLFSSNVVASKDGTIVYINDSHSLRGCNSSFARYNNVVVIRHANDEYTLYLHIQTGSVPQHLKDAYNQHGYVNISRGDLIGFQGNVGYTCGVTGTHLHLSTAYSYYVSQNADIYDEDNDGNTTENVETAWTSGHHKIDFDEYSYNQLASWPDGIPITSQNSVGSGIICSTTVPLPSGYTKCADEGGTCNFSGTSDVAYGANDKYTIKTGVSNSIACTNNAFGCDPNYGTSKSCYYKTTTSCPQSGGVILYWNADYDCYNDQGDPGYRQRTSTGWQNVNNGAFNDNASSLKVPSGWSVKLFEHADKNGASTCRSGDDSNFEGDSFDGGTVGLNDQVSSIEVFNNSNCGQSTGPGWDVRFYNDTNLSSECHHTNLDEPYVFEDWGESSPGGSCNSDSWSARYSKSVYFPGGDYTFGLGSDDWSRIKVGGNLVVNNWEGAGQHYEGRTLSGWHNVEIEFADTLGLARIAAWWRGPGFDMPNESRDPYQWYAEYWGNRDLWWDAIAKVNEGASNLNHNWGSGGPGYNLPVDDFGSRFQRRVYFDCGTYRFHITNDDGVRFWIDDESVLDEWRYHIGNYFEEVELSTGYHELKLEHFEGGGDAKISLDWSKLSGCTPNAPTNVLATDGTYSDKVRVTWNSVPDATFYEVFRADSSSGTKSQLTITTGTSHDNNTGTAGRTYYYWVRSGNSNGHSAFSSYNTGWRAIPVPSNVQASDGTYSDKVQVTWNSVPDATYYQVWRSDSSGGAKYFLRTSTSTTYYDTNATTGRTYYYWVKACSNRCSYFSFYDMGYRSTTLIQSKVFLPVIFNDQSGPSNIVSGIVTYKGIPVEGTQVLLRFDDGASWSTYDTTTTDINGKYSFTSLPDLETDQEYYIRWNNDVNTNRLSVWYCDSIYPSTIIPLAYICNFDLENIELLSPDPNTSISLPYTFSWQKRTLTSDDYELHMADMSDGMPWWGTLPGIGYVGSYTLNSLPTNFETGTAYGWYMWVHGPNGHGESYYYRNVTFLNSGAGLDTPAIVPKEYLHRDGYEMNIPGNVQEMGK